VRRADSVDELVVLCGPDAAKVGIIRIVAIVLEAGFILGRDVRGRRLVCTMSVKHAVRRGEARAGEKGEQERKETATDARHMARQLHVAFSPRECSTSILLHRATAGPGKETGSPFLEPNPNILSWAASEQCGSRYTAPRD
jgi:hypothetical protein